MGDSFCGVNIVFTLRNQIVLRITTLMHQETVLKRWYLIQKLESKKTLLFLEIFTFGLSVKTLTILALEI